MAKRKRRRTAAEKEARRQRKAKFQTVMINGKQKRVRREPTIDGLPMEEFLRRNAEPDFLHQMEMWWLIPSEGEEGYGPDDAPRPLDPDDREFWDDPTNWAHLVAPEEPSPPNDPEPEWDPSILEEDDDLPF